jgi:hypothetical protein
MPFYQIHLEICADFSIFSAFIGVIKPGTFLANSGEQGCLRSLKGNYLLKLPKNSLQFIGRVW